MDLSDERSCNINESDPTLMKLQHPLGNVYSFLSKHLLSLSEDEVEEQTDSGKDESQHNKYVVDDIDGHVEGVEDNNRSAI